MPSLAIEQQLIGVKSIIRPDPFLFELPIEYSLLVLQIGLGVSPTHTALLLIFSISSLVKNFIVVD
jgi:hypothetical protein